jgi:lipoate-protein ligase B
VSANLKKRTGTDDVMMADPPIDWEQFAGKSAALEVFLLGRVDFESALGLQSRLLNQIVDRRDTHGIVFLCEHPPAISIGREGSFADVLAEREELISQQVEIRWLNRGGGAFAHAPGQIAVYSLVPLARLGLGLLEYRRCLEQTLIATAADLKVDAVPGTAVPGATSRCGQFAFIGAGVSDDVTHGGLCVNVSVPPAALDLVRWTRGDQRVTSLAAQRNRPTGIATVRASLVRHLAESLGYDDYHLYTGHPLLHRSTRKVYVYA